MNEYGRGIGCLWLLASLVMVIFVGSAFPNFRRGLINIFDLSPTTALWVSICGSLILCVLSFIMLGLLGRYLADVTDDLRGWHVGAAAATYLAIGSVWGVVCRAGSTQAAPAWYDEPPSFLEAIMGSPPAWMLITERVIEALALTVSLWSLWVGWRRLRSD